MLGFLAILPIPLNTVENREKKSLKNTRFICANSSSIVWMVHSLLLWKRKRKEGVGKEKGLEGQKELRNSLSVELTYLLILPIGFKSILLRRFLPFDNSSLRVGIDHFFSIE